MTIYGTEPDRMFAPTHPLGCIESMQASAGRFFKENPNAELAIKITAVALIAIALIAAPYLAGAVFTGIAISTLFFCSVGGGIAGVGLGFLGVHSAMERAKAVCESHLDTFVAKPRPKVPEDDMGLGGTSPLALESESRSPTLLQQFGDAVSELFSRSGSPAGTIASPVSSARVSDDEEEEGVEESSQVTIEIMDSTLNNACGLAAAVRMYIREIADRKVDDLVGATFGYTFDGDEEGEVFDISEIVRNEDDKLVEDAVDALMAGLTPPTPREEFDAESIGATSECTVDGKRLEIPNTTLEHRTGYAEIRLATEDTVATLMEPGVAFDAARCVKALVDERGDEGHSLNAADPMSALIVMLNNQFSNPVSEMKDVLGLFGPLQLLPSPREGASNQIRITKLDRDEIEVEVTGIVDVQDAEHLEESISYEYKERVVIKSTGDETPCVIERERISMERREV